jgi:hypothetical protein
LASQSSSLATAIYSSVLPFKNNKLYLYGGVVDLKKSLSLDKAFQLKATNHLLLSNLKSSNGSLSISSACLTA